ncbi:MAG TPA: (Fe-S)-binding protein [Desulfatiglandales bacterium]|nr:(Fe-S)-binding protein [Desulfatiglandales bacterium]
MAVENRRVGKKIDISNLTWRQVMETFSCTRCGECVKWCPVYAQDSRESITQRDKLQVFRKIIIAQNSLRNKLINTNSWLGRLICPKPPTEDDINKAAEALYECSTCRQCHFICPSRIDTVELYEALRRALIDSGVPHISTHLPMVKSSESYDNPWVQPRATRARWTKVAKKEGRIQTLPRMIKPSSEVKKHAEAASKEAKSGRK